MKKKNVNEVENQEEKNLSFFEKYKTDKKYKAKVELIGYGIFIVVLIVYLNISSMNSNSANFQNITNEEILTGKSDNETTSLEKEDLLEKIDKNYEYDIRVSLKYLSDNEELDKDIHYFGKRYEDERIIDKELEDGKNTYYKIGSMYYILSDSEYQLIDKSKIYDLVDNTYIELDEVKKYLDISSLDHVTDYSSGKEEYVYHLKVRDVVKTYTGDEKIEFSLVSENDILTMKVDYSNLMKVIDKDILECKIEYVYQNVDKVEEFHIMNETNNKEVNDTE